jgi:hypothetical protein
VLVFISLASLGGAVACAVVNAVHSSYSERNHVAIPALLWLGASAAADWAIAGMLVWEIQRRRTRATLFRTDGIIRRLTKNAIRTGSVTSLVATMSLVAYFAAPKTNVTVAFGIVLGRFYTLTMLYNINNRGGLQSQLHQNEIKPSMPSSAPLHGERHGQAEVGLMTTALTFTRLSMECPEASGNGLWSTTDSHDQRASYRDDEWSRYDDNERG